MSCECGVVWGVVWCVKAIQGVLCVWSGCVIWCKVRVRLDYAIGWFMLGNGR